MAGDDLPVGNGHVQVPPVHIQNKILFQELVATLLLKQIVRNTNLHWMSKYRLLAQTQAA